MVQQLQECYTVSYLYRRTEVITVVLCKYLKYLKVSGVLEQQIKEQ